MYLSGAIPGGHPGDIRGNDAGFVNFGRQFKPGIVNIAQLLARHAIFPPQRTSLQEVATSVHGDGPITGGFTLLQILHSGVKCSPNQNRSEICRVFVNLPTGFGKSVTKPIVRV